VLTSRDHAELTGPPPDNEESIIAALFAALGLDKLGIMAVDHVSVIACCQLMC
jgi:hypothetical protein